jgi:hypothetical protein
MVDYDSLFCFVDDFSKAFVGWWQKSLLKCSAQWKKRNRSTRLHLREIITIMIGYHESGYRCFKDYYAYVLKYPLREFPKLVSYDRFVALMKRTNACCVDVICGSEGRANRYLLCRFNPLCGL